MNTFRSDAGRVEVRDIIKTYGHTQALNGISIDVESGELFGLIGPDGAGKSSLLRILVTVIRPDSGSATLDGLDVIRDYKEIRRRVGYMPGKFSLYHDLSVKENLEFFASVFGTTVEEQYDLIAPIYSQIEPFANRRAGALSGGMKQKLALSCALVHRPRVLILDEPTTGVDAVSRVEFWDMLAELRSGGITTIVSTPYMDEAARCDRIALLQDGALLRPPDTPKAITQNLDETIVRVRGTGPRSALLRDLRALRVVDRADVFGEWIHTTVSDRDVNNVTVDIRNQLKQGGWKHVEVEHTQPSIEDVFMALMSRATLQKEQDQTQGVTL